MRRKLHRHDLSTEKLLSGNLGYLIPTHLRMCYPGDVVRQRSDSLIRLSPLLKPILSKLMVKTETFFVPTDIIWDNAGDFYSRGQDGGDVKTIPTKTITLNDGAGVGSLANYLGFKPATILTNTFNILPFRAYNAIWNWHYRDRDLQTERVISTADGPDTTTDITLARRCWERDRFTTARLSPSRGDDVLIPMGDTSADVLGIGHVGTTGTVTSNLANVRESDGTTSTYPFSVSGADTGTLNSLKIEMKTNSTTSYPNIRAEIEGADMAGTIRELEEAVAINRFRLRLQQSDGSYPDYTLATFGIRSPDIELQKPVLLARSSQPLQISEVLQTAPDTDAGDSESFGVGNLAGHGITTTSGHGYKYRVKRHGYIMTIISLIPKSMYVQGNDKEWYRTTAEDYFDPDLDMIGEEAILGKEVSGDQTLVAQNATFGYNYRNYCDRSSLDSTAGEFDTTQNIWHQARDFGGADVALNSTFVTCTPTDRIFALGSLQNHFQCKAMHDVKMLRAMRRIPMRGVL